MNRNELAKCAQEILALAENLEDDICSGNDDDIQSNILKLRQLSLRAYEIYNDEDFEVQPLDKEICPICGDLMVNGECVSGCGRR